MHTNMDNCKEFAAFGHLPIYYGNIQSVPAKVDFRYTMSTSIYKVFCYTETWLRKEHDDCLYFPNTFTVYRQDRETRGGGTAIAVHNEFKSALVNGVCDKDCDGICVKIPLRPTPLLIYVAYVNKPERNVLTKH